KPSLAERKCRNRRRCDQEQKTRRAGRSPAPRHRKIKGECSQHPERIRPIKIDPPDWRHQQQKGRGVWTRVVMRRGQRVLVGVENGSIINLGCEMPDWEPTTIENGQKVVEPYVTDLQVAPNKVKSFRGEGQQ